MKLTKHFSLSAAGLTVQGKPTREEWAEVGQLLRSLEGGHQWAIGDWLAYGEGRREWGEKEKVTQEAADMLQLSDREVRRYKHVSDSVKMGNRCPELTWKHHLHVAGMPEGEQRRWLARALKGTNGKPWSAVELKRQIQARKIARKREEAVLLAPPEVEPEEVIRSGIYTGDFRELLPRVPSESVDLILTDPPYDEEAIPLYVAAAEHGSRVLREGGSLIAFAPHYALGRVITGMEQYLRFWWTIAVRHTGGNRRFPGKWVFVGWKPMVWFVKGGRSSDDFVSDFIESEADFQDNDGTRQLHRWQQGTKEAEYLISILTARGGLVLDPMCGSGTNCLAASRLERDFIGMDIDPESAAVTRGRVNDHSGVGAA